MSATTRGAQVPPYPLPPSQLTWRMHRSDKNTLKWFIWHACTAVQAQAHLGVSYCNTKIMAVLTVAQMACYGHATSEVLRLGIQLCDMGRDSRIDGAIR